MRSIAFLSIVSAAMAAGAADQPEVLVELGRERIYEGESVLYRVVLNHVENPSPPILEGFDDFEVQSRGERSLNSRQITIINGRRSEIVRYGRAYDYLLTPKRAGELVVPAPKAEIDGLTLVGDSLSLHVIPPQEQDLAFLEILADKTSVYPTQKFTITLSVAVKELPEPHSDQDPVEVLDRFPALSIPWVNDETLPEEVDAVEPWQRWIGDYIRHNGFSVNNLRATGSLTFFNDRPSAFMPPSTSIRRKDSSGKSAGYRQYMLRREFVASDIGQATFGPVTLKGGLPVRVQGRRLELEDVYAIARPVTVTIKDAPLEGRPASYSGAIGRFQWESRLVPTEAQAGDPLTLTLTLRGEGTLDAVAVPELAQDPQVADSFKVYEATEESSEDQRRFIYGLRPLRAGIEAFPPVSLTYFDVAKDQYIQLQSEPIPLQIGQAEQLSGEEIDVSANAAPASGEQIETQAGGIFANDSALRSLRNEAVDPVRWFAGLGSLAGVYLIAVVLNQKLRRLSGDPDLVRRRGAASRARRRLHQAAVDSGSDSQQTDRLQAAFAGLIADALGIPEAGLTLAEVRSRLKQWELDPELDTRFGRWCEACDAVRYGATSGAVDRLQQEARQLMDDLVRCLKRKRILR